MVLMKRIPGLIIGLFAATSAFAQDAPQDSATCRNGLFADDPPFALAEVIGEKRAYFHGDMNGCPWTRGACASPSYVVPGDAIIINKIRKGYACALYPNNAGGTAGWVPTRQMKLLFVDSHPPVSAWLGTWRIGTGNPEIEITQKFGQLHAKGQAFWPGRPETTDWPSIHVGELSGKIDRAGQRGTYSDENLCKVRFTLLRDYLIAGDNRQCGGANVSFSGVYRRK